MEELSLEIDEAVAKEQPYRRQGLLTYLITCLFTYLFIYLLNYLIINYLIT